MGVKMKLVLDIWDNITSYRDDTVWIKQSFIGNDIIMYHDSNGNYWTKEYCDECAFPIYKINREKTIHELNYALTPKFNGDDIEVSINMFNWIEGLHISPNYGFNLNNTVISNYTVDFSNHTSLTIGNNTIIRDSIFYNIPLTFNQSFIKFEGENIELINNVFIYSEHTA